MFKFLVIIVLVGSYAVAGHPVDLETLPELDEVNQTPQSYVETTQAFDGTVAPEYVKDYVNQNEGTFGESEPNQVPYLSVQHNVLQEGVADVKSLQEVRLTNDLAVSNNVSPSLDTSAAYYNDENDKQEQLSHSVHFVKSAEFVEPEQGQELTFVEPQQFNNFQNVKPATEEEGVSHSVKDSTLPSSVNNVESQQNLQSVTSFGVHYNKPIEFAKTESPNYFQTVSSFEKLPTLNHANHIESISQSSATQADNFDSKLRYVQPLNSQHRKQSAQVQTAVQTVVPLRKSESLQFKNHHATLSPQEKHLQQSKVYDTTTYEVKSDVRPDGFEYIMDAGNSIRSHAVGDEYGNVVGGYEWISPEGVHVKIDYEADENGYHPVGDLLPTPPPTPAAILRSLEYIRLHSTDDHHDNY